MAQKNSKMVRLLNSKLKVVLIDTRILIGQMIAFDKYMNMVLCDCEEFRLSKRRNKRQGLDKDKVNKTLPHVDPYDHKRAPGLTVIRGENIVMWSVEAGPPPSMDARSRVPASSIMGRGIGRPVFMENSPYSNPYILQGVNLKGGGFQGLPPRVQLGTEGLPPTQSITPILPPGFRPGPPLPSKPAYLQPDSVSMIAQLPRMPQVPPSFVMQASFPPTPQVPPFAENPPLPSEDPDAHSENGGRMHPET